MPRKHTLIQWHIERNGTNSGLENCFPAAKSSFIVHFRGNLHSCDVFPSGESVQISMLFRPNTLPVGRLASYNFFKMDLFKWICTWNFPWEPTIGQLLSYGSHRSSPSPSHLRTAASSELVALDKSLAPARVARCPSRSRLETCSILQHLWLVVTWLSPTIFNIAMENGDLMMLIVMVNDG